MTKDSLHFHEQKARCGSASKRELELQKPQPSWPIFEVIVFDEFTEPVPGEPSLETQYEEQFLETQEIIKCDEILKEPEPNQHTEVVDCEVCQQQFLSDQALESHWELEHSETHGMVELIKCKVECLAEIKN